MRFLPIGRAYGHAAGTGPASGEVTVHSHRPRRPLRQDAQRSGRAGYTPTGRGTRRCPPRPGPCNGAAPQRPPRRRMTRRPDLCCYIRVRDTSTTAAASGPRVRPLRRRGAPPPPAPTG
ncbi:hypothetical protein ACFPM0_14330 [Pseudonocardia sulfidoxydans]|uniref:hypothetical protein n=1 Tax=Pseudonocardia sulfidoxydans TaxID=54011 RepID=UPI003618AB0F